MKELSKRKRKGAELPINLWWGIFWLFVMFAAASMIYLAVNKGSWGIIGQIFATLANIPAKIIGM